MNNVSPSLVEGICDGRFAAVREQFERNFAEREELGAAVAIHVDGELVVDLWGGAADPARSAPWGRDTIVKVFSCTKGMTAACAHVLIDRGMLNIADPVAKYWPEFAANGKAEITVETVMSHQAGLPFWQTPVAPDGLLDWDWAVGALAAEAPVWEPGTTHAYHGRTIGFLEGELVRRVSGKSLGRFLREEIAEPLGADMWIGLPECEESRVAEVVMAGFEPKSSAMAAMLEADPEWMGWKLMNTGEPAGMSHADARRYRAAENPSGGGITNARGLSRLYAPLSLDGSVEGVRLVSEAALARMRTVRSASGCDLLLRVPTTFTLGFAKTWGRRSDGPGNHVIIGEQAFGAPGMGGSIGFADGQARMSFAYVMNRHGAGVGSNERGQSLVDAAYRSVGFTSSEAGVWVK